MSTRRIVMAVSAITCVLLAVSLTLRAEAHAKSARNGLSFYGYLLAYSDLELDEASREEWYDYGEAACEWLADQPYPWFSRADRFQHSALESRFWRENPAPPEWDSLDPNSDPKGWLVPAAWGGLCPDLWQWHEPHNPFNRARSD